MVGEIDLNLKPIKPELFLAKPNRTIVAKLTNVFGVGQELKLGGVNELKFSLPTEIDQDHEIVRNPHLDMLKERYLVKVVAGALTEWYRIEKIKDGMGDDGVPYKQAELLSLAIELRDKTIRAYEEVSINAQQALSDALSGTIWNTGYIDSAFLVKYRSFSVPAKKALDFVFEIGLTYNALVLFDTVNRTVSLYNPANIGRDRGLVVSYGKYMKSLDRDISADEIVTRLKVFGRDGLSINAVNPTGTSYIEDFSYFLYPYQEVDNGDETHTVLSSSHYMSDDLCHAILAYNAKVASRDGEFFALLDQKAVLDATLLVRKNELRTLQGELVIIQDNIDIAQSTGQDYVQLIIDETNKKNQIDAKKLEIAAVEIDVEAKMGEIRELQHDLAVVNNFTPEQIIERNQFIIEADWTDENYISPVDLYEEALRKLEDLKIPQVVIDVDIINFKQIVTEQRNWDKLNLGDTITIRYERLNIASQAKIIEMSFNYDENDVRLVISNITDMQSEQEKFIKKLYEAIGTSTEVDMSKFKWNGIEDAKDDISKILDNAWGAAERAINAGVNESVTIDRRGITITDPSQPLKFVRMTHGVIGITNDGGNSYKQVMDGTGVYAERLIGRIIAGNNLVIQNSGGTFEVNETGATLTDATLTLTRTDGRARIFMNANDGLQIQRRVGSGDSDSWTDSLHIDAEGNLKLRGSITMTGGAIQWGKDGMGVEPPSPEMIGARPYDWKPEWDDLHGDLPPQFTYIDANGIYTGILTAQQINAIDGIRLGANAQITWGDHLGVGGVNVPTAAEVGARAANWLPTPEEINAVKNEQTAVYNTLTNNGTVQGLFMGVDGNLYMNASYISTGTLMVGTGGIELSGHITWGTGGVNAPDAATVGARPDSWTPTAEEVGALVADPDEVYNVLTDGGARQGLFLGDDNNLYINANYIRGGTISGVTIDVDTVANIGHSLVLNSRDGVSGGMYFKHLGSSVGEMWFETGNMFLWARSGNLGLSATGTVNIRDPILTGAVDFSLATEVTGLNLVAKFG